MGYGKIDKAEEWAFRKKAHRHCIVLRVSFIVLMAISVRAGMGTSVCNCSSESNESALGQTQ